MSRRLIVLLVLSAACSNSSDPPPPATPAANPQLGDPIPGLTAAQLASFERGRAIFEKRFVEDEGHGPDFTVSSCRSCHEFPATGGSSPLYRNFTLAARDTGATFTGAFEDEQLVARIFSYTRPRRETIPADANVVTQRNAPPMFGVGRFVGISDLDISANADANDLNGDGISGRPNFDGVEVGRFGFKSQEANLEDFVRGPIFNHMGITTDPLSFGSQLAQVGTVEEPTTDNDAIPDPEMSFADLRDLVFFTEHLAVPLPLPDTPEVARGRELFEQVQCAKCHIPNIASAGPPVLAYTDLLLHDMGPGLADGVRMGVATGSEFRTQPLWGLRHHAPYLHDGRADTILDAILAHGGEATGSRTDYEALSPADQAALLAFLETR